MSYSVTRYLLTTVDPVHIGTGGSRLGRVDNSIMREPGTHLPKIPGTSLSGAVRQYAAYRYGKPQCAGQGTDQGQTQNGHCGQSTCPICYTFGTANNDGTGNSGVVSIGDARLLCFPVYSMQGPVWVTSPATLQDAGAGSVSVLGAGALMGTDLTGDNINLGWLMVSKSGPMPALAGIAANLPSVIVDRLVVVSDKLFSQVVNSNLEVRTSVSIDPFTGAAKKGALFTYEALPRATYLWFDLVADDYRQAFPTVDKQWQKPQDGDTAGDNLGGSLSETWDSADQVFKAGLEWAAHLGVGGMGTRGFGRIRMVPPPPTQNQGSQAARETSEVQQ
jgi:CRISPR-associated protein Cmr4